MGYYFQKLKNSDRDQAQHKPGDKFKSHTEDKKRKVLSLSCAYNNAQDNNQSVEHESDTDKHHSDNLSICFSRRLLY